MLYCVRTDTKEFITEKFIAVMLGGRAEAVIE